MSLPKYDKSKRKKTFEILPKGAYVIKILKAVEEQNKNNSGSHLTISFDIAEGDYKDFYSRQYFADSREDKKWNRDAVYYLTVPDAQSKPFVWDNWNTFFADLEDSNNGFVFDGQPHTLKGKIIGGKFAIEQSEYNGNVYDHTKLKWTCVADDIRGGKVGKMPNDKLISATPKPGKDADPDMGDDDFMKIDEMADEVPFL